MFHLILFVFFGIWLIFDALAVKKDIDLHEGEKKTVLDLFFGFPIAIFKAIKKLRRK